MASIRRKPGTRYFVACYTDHEGIQRQRSTKSTDRKFAQAMADKLEEAYRNQQTEAQIRRVLSDVHEELHGKPLESTTTEAYVQRYKERIKGEVEHVTFLAYRKTLDDFERFLTREGKWTRPLLNVDKQDIEKFRNECGAKASARTANNKLKNLRIFFGSAWADGIIPENPAKKVKALKAEPVNRRGFSITELKKILSVTDGEWHGMTLMGFYFGPRLKDIALMDGRKLDLERGIAKFRQSKTDNFINVPIAKPLAGWLKKHLPKDPDEPLFPKAHAIVMRTENTTQLSQQFHSILVKAELVKPRPPKHESQGVGRDGKRQRNDISFHSLRHTITTSLKMANVPESVARDIVGHESAAVSAEYTHVDDKSKRDALDKLPDLTSA